MSATFGLLRLDGRPASPVDLECLSQRLRHRGSAGVDVWLNGEIGLGTRSHHPASQAIEHQEDSPHDGAALAITGDIRIDNRKELLLALGLTSRQPEPSDAALVLRSYVEWGHHCAAKIVGDFVFTIWDARRRQLFCARDPVGLRSFFYHHAPARHFVFASEIQPLLSLAGVPHRLRPTRVAHYLLYAYEGKAFTFYDEIMRLPPGHSLTIADNTLTIQRFWSPDSVPLEKGLSDSQYAERFRELFFEAVRCRLPTNGPLAASLSGGLDSSSVVATARHLIKGIHQKPIQTFTVTWSGSPAADESPYIDALLVGGGLEAHFASGAEVDPFFAFAEMPVLPDEPPDNPLARSGWSLREQVRHRSVNVLLEGLGGDQTLSFAFSYLADLLRAGKVRSAMHEARALSRVFFGGGRSARSIFRTHALLPLIPLPIRRAIRSLRQWRNPDRGAFMVPLNPRFAAAINLRDLLRDMEKKRRAAHSDKRFHAYLFEEEFAASPLESYEAANALFGYESRCPFLDRRLIEYCLALPREQRIKDGLNRVIVRRALADLLPLAIRTRGGKGNANPAFAQALLRHGRAEMQRVIVEDPGPIEPFVDLPALRNIHQRLLQQASTSDAYSVWTAVTLARWLTHAGLSP